MLVAVFPRSPLLKGVEPIFPKPSQAPEKGDCETGYDQSNRGRMMQMAESSNTFTQPQQEIHEELKQLVRALAREHARADHEACVGAPVTVPVKTRRSEPAGSDST
jgi:hypothetical protein